MTANTINDKNVSDKQANQQSLPDELAHPPHRIAELIGVFADDPVWVAIMDEVRTRRQENEQEAVETTKPLPEIPTLHK